MSVSPDQHPPHKGSGACALKTTAGVAVPFPIPRRIPVAGGKLRKNVKWRTVDANDEAPILSCADFT